MCYSLSDHLSVTIILHPPPTQCKYSFPGLAHTATVKHQQYGSHQESGPTAAVLVNERF